MELPNPRWAGHDTPISPKVRCWSFMSPYPCMLFQYPCGVYHIVCLQFLCWLHSYFSWEVASVMYPHINQTSLMVSESTNKHPLEPLVEYSAQNQNWVIFNHIKSTCLTIEVQFLMVKILDSRNWVNVPCFWMNWNDLTVTSLFSMMLRANYPVSIVSD